MIYICIIGAIAIVTAALMLVGLGMSIANRYNKIAWDKFREAYDSNKRCAGQERRNV